MTALWFFITYSFLLKFLLETLVLWGYPGFFSPRHWYLQFCPWTAPLVVEDIPRLVVASYTFNPLVLVLTPDPASLDPIPEFLADLPVVCTHRYGLSVVSISPQFSSMSQLDQLGSALSIFSVFNWTESVFPYGRSHPVVCLDWSLALIPFSNILN